MDSMFEATRKLWSEERDYWTGQMTRLGETLSAEAEKAARTAQDTWTELVERQSGLVTEYTRHLTTFAEKQMTLWQSAARSAVKSAAEKVARSATPGD